MATNDQILLNELLKQEKESLDANFTESEYFEFYTANQILKQYELSYDEIMAGMVGQGHDGGADLIYLFVNDELIKEDSNTKEKYKKNPDIELVIIQSKKEPKFKEDPLLKLSRLSKNLLDLNFEKNNFIGRYNESVLSMFELFKKTYLNLVTKQPSVKIRFCYASIGSDIHSNVKKQAEDLKNDIKDILPTAKVIVDFYNAHNLVLLSQERPNEVFRLSTAESPLSTSEKVFIALTNIKDYFKFISDENGKLLRHIFESNVRDYQGKTNVNKEIQDTLLNNTKEEFWWLNNGVTILASDVATPGGKELVIHNPQIVNGLQTSSEIHRFFSNNPDRLVDEHRAVLLRFIVPKNDETRDRIIRATNSQTPIPKSSLRATDIIHRNIEEFFKSRNLFYDRRKNYYKNEGKKPKEIISLPFLSQCLMSTLLQRPDTARARPSTLLENDESYNKLFNENHALITYFTEASWGRAIELRLKDTKKYETAEISDIKFYVLYYLASIIVNSIYPSNKKFNDLNDITLDNTQIDSAADFCYDLYRDLGGTNKIAKGTEYLKELKVQLKKIVT